VKNRAALDGNGSDRYLIGKIVEQVEHSVADRIRKEPFSLKKFVLFLLDE
jgi:hypothetical protein